MNLNVTPIPMLTECTSSTFTEAHSKDWLVPGYEVVEVIGEGGFSLVYRARQRSTGQDVAIKILHLSKAHNHLHYERSIERFEREIRLCAGLQHPNIVKLLDKGETTDKRLFAVFEYVPGQTLREHIKNTGAMTAPEAGHVMAQVLDALICAHKQGIVHRDLKPQNIMLTTSGVNAQVKILDFGIGTIVPQFRPADFLTLTQSQESCGTPSYSAPEQLRGEPATVQADLYAWGLVYLECLMAVPVMQGASAAEIYHRQLSPQEVPIPPAIINHPLAGILRRVLKKKPDERCADAQSLWRALREINLADIVGVVHSACEQYPPGNETTLMNSGAFKEKRQITVLCISVSVVPDFNDAMVKSSDIEVLEILQQDQLNQCRDIASRFGGKIAGCLADRMLVYFGYPGASDTAPRRAARSALEITRVMKRRAQQLEEQGALQLHTRAGIHTGMVVIKHDEVPHEVPQGYVANIALRLESEAQVGQILASEVSFKCLKRYITFEKDKRRDLSGECLSVQTWRLTGQRHADAHHLLAEQSTRNPFVGNYQQLQWLKQKWQQVARKLNTPGKTEKNESQGNATQAVLVQGEAGIGKSRLLQELYADVHDQGHHFYVCHCLPEHKNNGLFPFLELIRQTLNISESTPSSIALNRLELEFSQAGCSVERVLPILCTWLALPIARYPVSQVSPQRQKAWLLQAIAEWLIYLSKDQALLLVVEDLHWLDPTSLELLNKLSSLSAEQAQQSATEKALLLVMTARPEFQWPHSDSRNDSWNDSWSENLDTLQVSRLDKSGTQEMIYQLAGNKKLHPTVISRIVMSTGGVPLFVEELTQMLIDKHLLEKNGFWQLKNNNGLNEIPLTLRDLLIGQLDNLTGAKDTVQIAASIGREFDYELLACVVFKSREELDRDIAEMLNADLIYKISQTHKNQYVFRHNLIREAACEAMLTEARQQTHQHIAHVLSTDFPERLKTHPEEVAEHYSLGERPEKSSQYFIKAANLAASTYSNQEALNFYTQAVDDINKVTPAVTPAGHTPGRANKRVYAQAVIDLVQNSSSQAYEGIGDSAGLLGDHTHARQAFNHALNSSFNKIGYKIAHKIVPDSSESRARILRKIAKSWEVSHQHKKSLLIYQQSENSLGELSNVLESATLLDEWLKINSGKLYVNYWDNNNIAMKKILDIVQPVVKQRGNRRQQAAVILDELLFSYRETRYRLENKTVSRAYELVAIAKQCDDPELLAQAQHELGLCLLFSQGYTEARRELDVAVKLSEAIDDSVLQCRNLTYLAVAHRMLNQVEEVERIAQLSFERAERMQMTDYIGAASANLAWVAWRRENHTEAARLVTHAIKCWRSLGSRYPYPFQWYGLLILIAIKLENNETEVSYNKCNAQRSEIIEYVDTLLNNNQQVLPEKINNILLNIKNKEKISINSLKNIVKIASYEGLL